MDTRENKNSNLLEGRDEYMKSLLQWIEAAKKWQKDQLDQAQRMLLLNSSNQLNPYLLNQQGLDAFEYIVPPLWKRLAAELIDFCLLFLVKTLIVFSLLESFEIITSEDFGLETFNKNLHDSEMMYNMSMEFLILELMHRLVVFIYETFWLSMGPKATPGKMFMGLMVVHASVVTPIQGREYETVKVFTGTQLTLKEAFIRSVVKSLFLSFAIPLCFALLFFKHNRTGYDLMSHTMVVEYHPNPPQTILY